MTNYTTRFLSRTFALGALLTIATPAYAGSDRVKMFIGDLHSDVGEVRAGAALALGEAGDRRAVKPLEKVLNDEFVDVRKAAAWSLGQLGDKASSAALLKSLEKDSAPQVRSASAGALGMLKVASTAPALKVALADSDAMVRASSVEALASVSGKDAVPDARELLRDGNWSVRSSALNALGTLKDNGSVNEICGVLAHDDAELTRAGAAHALGKIGDKSAIPALRAALKDGSDRVRAEAGASLARLGAPAEDDVRNADDVSSKTGGDGAAIEL